MPRSGHLLTSNRFWTNLGDRYVAQRASPLPDYREDTATRLSCSDVKQSPTALVSAVIGIVAIGIGDRHELGVTQLQQHTVIPLPAMGDRCTCPAASCYNPAARFPRESI